MLEGNLLRRNCIESALIARPSTVNMRSGSYNISLFLADILLSQCGILNNKSGKNKQKEQRN